MCEISSDNRLGPLCQRFCSCFCRTACLLVCLRPLALSFLPRYRQYAATAQRWDPWTHVRVATTPELLGLCEKAGRRAPAAPPIDLECLAPTRRQRRALVRRLRRRTSRSPLVECARLRREPPLPCPTPPATTTCPSPSSKLPRSPPRSPRPSPRPRSRRRAPRVDDSDDEPVKPPPKKRAKPKPKYKESSDDDSSDSDDEPIQKKRAARKPAKRKAPAKKEPAPKRRKSSTGSTARKPKQLTKVQRLEKALGAFEWWNAPDPPEGKSWTTLEHAGVTFEPQYVPHNVPLVYEGQPVKLTPRQEELATFYASMPEDGPQLSVKGGQREIFQKNFWDDFSKALGSSHTIKSFKGCDFTRISEHLDRQKAIRRSASDAEKKATKEMKDKQLLKSGFACWMATSRRSGIFGWSRPRCFAVEVNIQEREWSSSGRSRIAWRSTSVGIARRLDVMNQVDLGRTCSTTTVLLGSRRGTRTCGLGVLEVASTASSRRLDAAVGESTRLAR